MNQNKMTSRFRRQKSNRVRGLKERDSSSSYRTYQPGVQKGECRNLGSLLKYTMFNRKVILDHDGLVLGHEALHSRTCGTRACAAACEDRGETSGRAIRLLIVVLDLSLQ